MTGDDDAPLLEAGVADRAVAVALTAPLMTLKDPVGFTVRPPEPGFRSFRAMPFDRPANRRRWRDSDLNELYLSVVAPGNGFPPQPTPLRIHQPITAWNLAYT